jgi:hypothetical protein
MNEWIKKVNDSSRDRKIKKSETSMSAYKEHWYKMVSQKIKDNGIIESNSLMAVFMGYDIDDKNEFFYGLHYYKIDADSLDKTYDQLTIENVRSYTTDGFVWNYTDFTERRYDNHWDMLMPVIEKINKTFFDYYGSGTKLRCTFCINDDWAQILNNNKEAVIYNRIKDGERLINAAYKTVVQFINFYNEKNDERRN